MAKNALGAMFNAYPDSIGARLSDTVELPMATSQTAFGSPAILVEGLSVAGK